MKTPIYDFLKKYAKTSPARFHMPGHKGRGPLGVEEYDITEIFGADNLFSADGIIKESEDNATRLFGTAHTFYSTEGSTLAIKAMLKLATAKNKRVVAARAVHKAFIYAAALLDLDVEFVSCSDPLHFADSRVSPYDIRNAISRHSPSAVYITSPDYLGSLSDIREIADICHKMGVLLLVDNAHGAYLNFLSESLHPIALGADMSCDSAHKTLPALTGAAYLHISKNAPAELVNSARGAMSLFASTSPSYLIMASLDLTNAYIADGYSEKLDKTVVSLNQLKSRLAQDGVALKATEPLKLVIPMSQFSISLGDFIAHLNSCGISPEMVDSEFAVFMVTPENSEAELEALYQALVSIARKGASSKEREAQSISPKRVMSIREAVFSESESVSVTDAVGRICASPVVSCPPAVPIVISGEYIDERVVTMLIRYGVSHIDVVK